MIVDEIFSIPFFSESLSLDNENILEYCISKQKGDWAGNTVSNSGGWQSNPFYKVPTKLEELFSNVERFSVEVCDVLGVDSAKFVNGWININGNKDFNWPHTHADSILSGVYYVQTPENCGGIVFEHPNIETMECVLDPSRIKVFNKFNSIGWQQKPQVGMLCLFPGWAKHYVNQNMSDENRISISFNLQ
jgi:uncharacterized protein (TIGR02466 family)